MDGSASNGAAPSPSPSRDKSPRPSKHWKTAAIQQGLRRSAEFFKQPFRSVNGGNGSSSLNPQSTGTANISHQNLAPTTTPQTTRPLNASHPGDSTSGISSTTLSQNGSSEWAKVLESFHALVGQKSFSEIQCAKPIDRLQEDLQRQLQTMPLPTFFSHENRKTVNAVLDGLRALSGLATVLAPSSPEIGAMILGSIRMIITNSKSDSRLALAVITHLEPISQKFQRFGRYLEMFPSSEHLRRVVEIFSHHVVDLLGYAVKSLQGPNYALPPRAIIEESLQKKVDLINQTCSEVEREAQAAKFQADESWKQREHSPPRQQLKLPQTFSCFDIPMNRKFCGREDIVEKLHGHLIGPENNPLPGASVLIHGLGGMGKSSIAVNFAYDHADVYKPLIFWFSADTRQKATTTAARVCKELGINLGDPANELTKAAFTWRSWLEQHDSWLVVYDNVEDEALLRDLWPRNNKGTIIVTSRRPDITGTLVESGLEIDVSAMSLPESRHLLFKLLPSKYGSLSTDPEQVSVVDQLCELLDGLPLAIVLAAALIKQTLRTFDEALKLLTEKRELLMRWPLPNDAVASLPLAMLWEANIASLPDGARSMLQVMAFLDPDNIQEEMLLDEKVLKLHDVLPADRETYLHCLRSLSSYSLIRRDRSMLCVHRLVQDATIFRMNQKDLRNALDAAVDLIWISFPKQSQNGLLMSSVLHLAQSYLPHVEALGKRYHQLATSVNYKSLHLAELAYYCSWSMYERGMFGPSVKLARTGLAIVTALPCETRLLAADLWTVIGGVQLEGTELAESYQSLKMALDLRLDAVQAGLMDEKHPQIANSYMGLGTAAVGIGRVQEALKLGEQSIAQRAGRPDEQIQMFAMSYHNVALAALHNGQLDKADALIKQSIQLTSVTSKSMTPEQKLAMDARNIYCKGNIFWARGMKKEAQECHHRALEVRISAFDEVHPYTACAYWKLGRIWEDEDWRKAETYYVESVRLYEGLTMVESHLGRALLHLGRLRLKHGIAEGQEPITQAKRLYQKITREEFDEEHDNPFQKVVHPFYN